MMIKQLSSLISSLQIKSKSKILSSTYKNTENFHKGKKTYRLTKLQDVISKPTHRLTTVYRTVPVSVWIQKKMEHLTGGSSGLTPIKPPEDVRGMKTFNHDSFKITAKVATLEVPCKKVTLIVKSSLKNKMLKRHKLKGIAEIEDKPDYKLFLLDPGIVSSPEDFNEEEKQILKEADVDLSSWKVHDLELNHKNFTYREIIEAILPKIDGDLVGGFSFIGHIVHLNLRKELVPYKNVIGEVLLEMIPPARTVVNKTTAIDNTYRNFQMEIIAGEAETVTEVREHGCTFKLDFAKVYWNPKLETEHWRVIDRINQGDVLYDMFAGIGPFSVPAAKRKAHVYANDLNPESFKWLNENMKINNIKSPVKTYNMDGREFVRTVVKQDMLERAKNKTKTNYKIHIAMNLPMLAVEFLDIFVGLLSDVTPERLDSLPDPAVYCYGFSGAEDPFQDMRERVQEVLGCPLPEGHVISYVRNVAPKKEMVCAKFNLPKHVLLHNETEEPVMKRQKVEQISEHQEEMNA